MRVDRDDSAVVRQTISEINAAHPQFEVMATANDPFQSADRSGCEWPDVIVLDVEMQRMDGIAFLRRLKAQRPGAVAICFKLVGDGNKTYLAALEACPRRRSRDRSSRRASTLRNRRSASRSRSCCGAYSRLAAHVMLAPSGRTAMAQRTHKVVAIGASTCGTKARRVVLLSLGQS